MAEKEYGVGMVGYGFIGKMRWRLNVNQGGVGELYHFRIEKHHKQKCHADPKLDLGEASSFHKIIGFFAVLRMTGLN